MQSSLFELQFNKGLYNTVIIVRTPPKKRYKQINIYIYIYIYIHIYIYIYIERERERERERESERQRESIGNY